MIRYKIKANEPKKKEKKKRSKWVGMLQLIKAEGNEQVGVWGGGLFQEVPLVTPKVERNKEVSGDIEKRRRVELPRGVM